MQGLLKRAYKDLPEACYIMLQIRDVDAAKKWIAMATEEVTPASVKPATHALHLGFTYDGVKKLLAVGDLTEPFSREFTEGIKQPQRSRILGDVNENSPEKWHWNNTGENAVDMVIMIFAGDKQKLEEQYREHSRTSSSMGYVEVTRLDTTAETSGREHFGFQDGLQQPRIKGFGENINGPGGANDINPGEFIFGFKNEYDKFPISPHIKIRKTGKVLDIGKNGSYMVFRQLEQDVKKFWKFMYDTAKTDPDFADKDAVYIAAKMMGRWPNGNPLHLASKADDPVLPKEEMDNFLFRHKDPDGFGCPIGSHVRKSNPRDGMDSDPVTSIAVAKRHRILRRGRPYGEPLAPTMAPQDMLESEKAGTRGLYFICFNTNISRQFEFINHTWNNNAKFDGLYNDIDPIMGFPFLKGEYTGSEFTIQACPFRKKVKDIPQFVYVRGGAYFFLPSISTLRLMGSE